METEKFVAWALSPERDVEDRYTLELLVQEGVDAWKSRRNIQEPWSLDETMARARERELNPAYEPKFTEEGLRQTAESLATLTNWHSRDQRPIRSLSPLVFFPTLEHVSVSYAEIRDFEPLTRLPRLRKLDLRSYRAVGLEAQEDFTPIGRCRGLRELDILFTVIWPNFEGLDALPLLEKLRLEGNLLALSRGSCFPHVRRAKLFNGPLAARSVADLPRLPACEFLELGGVERFDGIEASPRLRNLLYEGPLRSFEPLVALRELTTLDVYPGKVHDTDRTTRDVAPLARLPKLASFQIGPRFDVWPDLPRDYSPLVESPSLRELVVRHCPPVAMEVAAINAALAGWEDAILRPEGASPELLAEPLKIFVGERDRHREKEDKVRRAEGRLLDEGMLERATGWFRDYVQAQIAAGCGHPEWGEVEVQDYRPYHFTVVIECYAVVREFPAILEATRRCLAATRERWEASLRISLRLPEREQTEAEKQLEKQLAARQDEWEYEQDKRERAQYLENLHRVELKRQQGEEISPEEFSPPPSAKDYPQLEDLLREKGHESPPPSPPGALAGRSDDDDGEDGEDDRAEGEDLEEDVGERTWPLEEGEHPLAEKYWLWGEMDVAEAWFGLEAYDLVTYLLRRPPDGHYPEDAKPKE